MRNAAARAARNSCGVSRDAATAVDVVVLDEEVLDDEVAAAAVEVEELLVGVELDGAGTAAREVVPQPFAKPSVPMSEVAAPTITPATVRRATVDSFTAHHRV